MTLPADGATQASRPVASTWKEIKGYRHYAVIGSEARGHGIQIFDLRRVSPCLFSLLRRVGGLKSP